MLASTGVVVGGAVPAAVVDDDDTGLVVGEEDEVPNVFGVAPPQAARITLKHAATTQDDPPSAFISLLEYASQAIRGVPRYAWS